MAQRRCQYVSEDGITCRAPAKKGSTRCRHHPETNTRHTPAPRGFEATRAERWALPDTVMVLEAHPRLGLYLTVQSAYDQMSVSVGTQEAFGVPAPPEAMHSLGFAGVQMLESCVGPQVAGNLLDAQFKEPMYVLLNAIYIGQKVYARGEQVQAHLRETLEALTLTLGDGTQFPGSEFIERVLWDDEPPCKPFYDPALAYEHLTSTEPFSPDATAAADPPGECEAVSPPSGRTGETAKSLQFPIHTCEEINAILAAASDGKRGSNYHNDEQAGTRTHIRTGSPFFTRLALLDDELQQGQGVSLLDSLTSKMSADAALALLYVTECLAPVAPLVRGQYAGGWVDLADVARKIGLVARSSAEAEQLRRFIWDVLRFGARAHVVGERSIPYYDKTTNTTIPTTLSSPLWAFMDRQQPVQPALLEADTVPVRVEVVMSKRWAEMITDPRTRQYLPFGEVLGKIPGGKPGGAYARVIGMAFLQFCRCHPRQVLNDTLRPSRSRLLTTYEPAVSPPAEVLESNDPQRAVEYWYAALEILIEARLVAREGEAGFASAKTATKSWKSTHPRQDWQAAWLAEKVRLVPGELLRPVVEACAASQYPDRKKRLGPGRTSLRRSA